MPILPLPQFEADLEADRKAYEKLKAPKSIVVRFGLMKMVGEFPYDGDAKPGCGSKLIIRTHRGTELGEMLTSTCPNAGCSKSVSRKEMLQYIENSGGRDYPFTSEGRVLRVATVADLDKQAQIEQSRHALKVSAREAVERLNLPMKVVDAEPILGGERLTFYYISEERIDFRDLVKDLAAEHHARIEMRQVGARDEARLTADYERCGQYCCCKNFLKVLKPISMRAAKIQKATLDPLKISGRCGRLMCCLRYEDATYEELRKKLPKRKQRVGTPEGDGWVIDTQILTQLALIQLEAEDRQVAVPVEELKEPSGPRPAGAIAPGMPPPVPGQRGPGGGGAPSGPGGPKRERPGRRPEGRPGGPAPEARPQQPLPKPAPEPVEVDDLDSMGEIDDGGEMPPAEGQAPEGGPPPSGEGASARRRRRRRRRGRKPGGEGGPAGGDGPPPGPAPTPPAGG